MINVGDTTEGVKRFSRMRDLAVKLGYKSALLVPLLQEGKAIGCIAILRATAGEFDDQEIALAADLRRPGRDRDPERAAVQRDQGGAGTADRHRRSAAGDQRFRRRRQTVFEKILDSCKRLIPSDGGAVLVVDDQQQVEVGAVHGDRDGMFTRGYPRPIERTVLGLAFDSRRPLYYPEAITAEGVPDVARRFAQKSGFASILVAPMIWEGRRIGCISIARQAAFAFSEKDIDLLKTFADQARDRHPERAPVPRDQRGAGAADRHRRSAAGDQQLGGRRRTGVRQDPRQLPSTCSPSTQLGIFLVGDDGLVHVGAWRGSALDAIVRTFPKPLERLHHRAVIRERRTVHVADVAAMTDAAGRRARRGRAHRQLLGRLGADAVGRPRNRLDHA